jgi:(heptosyl)LPS beta-1,4-glucosyltransferase
MPALSIVYITLNADQYLAESLSVSLQLSNNILIVDSGSQDRTLSIAREYGVKIVHQDWLGFSAQKQLAINAAQHDWVLFLDADEILTTNAVQEISQALSKNDLPSAFSLPRKNYFQGKWIQHGSWWPDRVVRLINRQQGQMKPVQVHECWQTVGKVYTLQSAIRHYSYGNYSELLQKADSYSSLAAQEKFAQGLACSKWSPLGHAIAAFMRLFVLKRGFLDGIEGAAIAYTTALASFMKYAKLQELHRNK